MTITAANLSGSVVSNGATTSDDTLTLTITISDPVSMVGPPIITNGTLGPVIGINDLSLIHI